VALCKTLYLGKCHKKKTRQVHKNLMSFQTDILTFPLKKAYNLLIAVM